MATERLELPHVDGFMELTVYDNEDTNYIMKPMLEIEFESTGCYDCSPETMTSELDIKTAKEMIQMLEKFIKVSEELERGEK